MKQQQSVNTLILLTLALALLSACEEIIEIPETYDYAVAENWAYFPQGSFEGVDVFFVAPTVYTGDFVKRSMNISDPTFQEAFVAAINREKGIYDSAHNFYAPFYRQAGAYCVLTRGAADHSKDSEVEYAFDLAYDDVLEAFNQYLDASDRPFILAGSTQGSEHLLQLIKSEFGDTSLQKRHIATYAIGWRLSQAEVDQFPHLNNAMSADDLGVVITFNSEAEGVDSSFIVPKNTLSINPLGWTTDNNYMNNSYHLGACFTNDEGEIETEIPHFSGAYISPTRGTVILPEISPTNYPPILGNLSSGIYHMYDYSFFYRNLQENVNSRIQKYLELHPSK